MQRPGFLNPKLMFQDFPKEFIIKTYLGSRVLVILWRKSKLVILKEDNTLIRFSEIDLQASKDEIQDKHSKVGMFCEEFNRKNEPKKSKKAKKAGVSMAFIEDLERRSVNIRPTYHTNEPPSRLSEETLRAMAGQMRTTIADYTVQMDNAAEAEQMDSATEAERLTLERRLYDSNE